MNEILAGGYAEALDAIRKLSPTELIKFNPYHDAWGRFASANNAHVTSKANVLAGNVLERAKQDEAKVTADMKAFAGDMKLEGLDFRLKGQDSLQRKIITDASKDRTTLEGAASKIGDSLRYTYTVEAGKYTENVQSTLKKFEAAGYKVAAFKNNWGGDIYQGINTNLITPSGLKIELQFHTPESFHVKQNINHVHYETFRSQSASKADKAKAWDIMYDEQRKVPVPSGIQGVKGVA